MYPLGLSHLLPLSIIVLSKSSREHSAKWRTSLIGSSLILKHVLNQLKSKSVDGKIILSFRTGNFAMLKNIVHNPMVNLYFLLGANVNKEWLTKTDDQTI